MGHRTLPLYIPISRGFFLWKTQIVHFLKRIGSYAQVRPWCKNVNALLLFEFFKYFLSNSIRQMQILIVWHSVNVYFHPVTFWLLDVWLILHMWFILINLFFITFIAIKFIVRFHKKKDSLCFTYTRVSQNMHRQCRCLYHIFCMKNITNTLVNATTLFL